MELAQHRCVSLVSWNLLDGAVFGGCHKDIMKLAQKFGGEIISADSRQVYRGMNLGTGKVEADHPAEIPKEFLLCLQDDIVALQFFNSLIESEQYKYIRWIYSAKGEQTRVDRIAKTVTKLANRKKFADKE